MNNGERLADVSWGDGKRRREEKKSFAGYVERERRGKEMACPDLAAPVSTPLS